MVFKKPLYVDFPELYVFLEYFLNLCKCLNIIYNFLSGCFNILLNLPCFLSFSITLLPFGFKYDAVDDSDRDVADPYSVHNHDYRQSNIW